MHKYLLGIAILSVAAILGGCGPAEVKPPAEAIPSIPPGRASTPAAGATDGGAAAAPAGRTPAAPK